MKIAAKSQIAVRLAKEAVNKGMETDLAKGSNLEAELFALCFSAEDSREGIDAFLEKRPAKFPYR
jgi:enoyl-CoA hydratase